MKQNEFPAGWDEERVRQVIAHYEQQTEEEAVAEDEALQKTLSAAEIDEIVVAQADDEAAWEPANLDQFKLPPGVNERLQDLLGRQDQGEVLTADELTEAERLVNSAEMLSLLRLRMQRI